MTDSTPAGEETPVAWRFKLKGEGEGVPWVLSPRPTPEKNARFYDTEPLFTRPTPAAAADLQQDPVAWHEGMETPLSDFYLRGGTRPAAPVRTPIDANELERIAKARPDEYFLKGSGVLKLIGGIRQLERELRELRLASPVAPVGVPQLTDEQIKAIAVQVYGAPSASDVEAYGAQVHADDIAFARALLSHPAAPGGHPSAPRSSPLLSAGSELPRRTESKR